MLDSVPNNTMMELAIETELASDSTFCTYFGGSAQEDATKIAFDNDGNTILIGQSQSTDLPVTDGALQETYGGGDWDAFVAKFSETGSLLWATYLGGSGYEHVTSVNLDSTNNILLSGTTGSTNFHTTPDAYQSSNAGGTDGFVLKLDPDGALLYSSYLGGSGEDWIYGMETDDEENYLFAGWTTSSGLATTGAYKESIEGIDAFVARLSNDGSDLEMFSYVGGTGSDRAWTMTIDTEYNYVISGVTESTDLDVTDEVFQIEYFGGTDAYLAVVANNGSTLLAMTYLGGTGEDMGLGVAVDSEGNLILAGPTESDDLPLPTSNALQDTYGGGNYDSYVAKFTSTCFPIFVTYLGGNSTDRTWDVRVTADDTIVSVGRTLSYDFPVANGIQMEKNSNYDAFATELSADGQTILRSSFFGGGSEDIGEGIAVDDEGSIVISGRSSSDNLETTPGVFQEEKDGGRDVFVSHNIFEVQDTQTTTPTQPTEPEEFPIPILIAAVTIGIIVAIVVIIKKVKS
jgi:hypothetical protein